MSCIQRSSNLVLIFFPTQCVNVWDYSIIYCGGACYIYVSTLITFDWFFHYALTILIIVVSNVALFCCIIWRKIQRQQAIDWRRQRRLIIQLSFISSLFVLFAGPTIVVGVIQALWVPTFIMDIQNNYLFYLAIYVAIFYPFVIVTSLPEAQKELKQGLKCLAEILQLKSRREIHPLNVPAMDQTQTRTRNTTLHASRSMK